MKRIYQLSYLTMFICLPLQAITYDKQEEINGVTLQTGKVEKTRHYEASYTHTYSIPVQVLKNSITNFSEKCNNKFKNKRKLTDVEMVCKFEVEQLIESLVIRDIGSNYKKDPSEMERYLVARKVYRRGNYAHYDLVQVTEGKNDKGQNMVTITLNMLSDEEVGKYITPAFKKDSDFSKNSEVYSLTSIAPDKTELSYQFHAETEHWLLNKQLSVPQVFAYIGQNIKEKVQTLDNSPEGKREVASHK
ncbi:MAG TPA: hypothetical protein VNJ08_15770 [Bacteriovoracaceae bacterium]|nr:hypothetical protein [Bacteriovoracaceae bacterium]